MFRGYSSDVQFHHDVELFEQPGQIIAHELNHAHPTGLGKPYTFKTSDAEERRAIGWEDTYNLQPTFAGAAASKNLLGPVRHSSSFAREFNVEVARSLAARGFRSVRGRGCARTVFSSGADWSGFWEDSAVHVDRGSLDSAQLEADKGDGGAHFIAASSNCERSSRRP